MSQSDDKPLHVRVAEALGCKPFWFDRYGNGLRIKEPWWSCGCHEKIHNESGIDNAPHEGDAIERYDIDWSATGPLIMEYGINLERAQAGRTEGGPYAAWRWAKPGDETPPRRVWGDTALLAVCHLILALKEAGKL